MVNLRLLQEPLAQAGDFSSLLPVLGFYDDDTLLAKTGDLLLIASLTGPDHECQTPETVERYTDQFCKAITALGDEFTVQRVIIKRSAPAVPFESHENPVVAEALAARRQMFMERSKSLYELESYILLTRHMPWGQRAERGWRDHFFAKLRGLAPWIVDAFDSEATAERFDGQLAESHRQLHDAFKGFREQLKEAFSCDLLTKDELYRFLRQQWNPNKEKAAAICGAPVDDLDYWICDSVLECHRDHLRLDEYYLRTLTVKLFPAESHAGLLQELLTLQTDCYLTWTWRSLSLERSLRLVRDRRRHAHNTKIPVLTYLGSDAPSKDELLVDKSREATADALGDLQKALELDEDRLGSCSVSIVLVTDTRPDLLIASAEANRVCARHGFALNEERFNGLCAFLATTAGGYSYDYRRQFITARTFSDCACIFHPAQGDAKQHTLHAPSLIQLQTEDRTLYRFNLQHGPTASGIIVGPTGSGKSFVLGTFLLHALKYSPKIIILDASRSFGPLTTLCGGSSLEISPDRLPKGLNPFHREPTAVNLQFSFSFVVLLIELGGYTCSDQEKQTLFDAIKALYVLAPAHRRLQTLCATLPKRIADLLRRWTAGEQYGDYFDHEADDFRCSSFQYFSLENLEQIGEAAEPLIYYLLHCANTAVCDPASVSTFKLVVVDEAWKFLRYPTTRSFIETALRTWRKWNAGMLLATQTLNDVSSSEIVRVVLENSPSKYLFANPGLDAETYKELLRLNPIEIETVRSLIPRQQFLLKRDQESKVLNLHVDSRSYWLYTTNPLETARRAQLLQRHDLRTVLDLLQAEGGPL